VEKMTNPTDEKKSQSSADHSKNVPDEHDRLPDKIVDEEQPEIVDLPRPGIPKDVLNVSKASTRLPELLIEE